MANLVHSSSTLISPLLSNIKGEATRNLSLLSYLSSLNDNPKNDTVLKEENYLELSSDSAALTMIKENNGSLNLEATELTLGPPRSQSPEKDVGLDSPKTVTLDKNEKNLLFTSHPSMDGVCSSITKTLVSGNKRAFSDTIDEKSCASKSEVSLSETSQSTSQGNTSVTNAINIDPPRALVQQQSTANGTSHNSNAITPTDKAEVVAGWPPVKARKNTQAASPKNNDKVDGKRALLVKVGMNGAPYLRKVDLRSYSTYQQLSSALQKMFNCFTLGTCGAQEAPGTEIWGENGLRDQKQGSKHVITYEDKDGDMMLVGDVPWEMFIESCKKLKIMKGSDAIGFGPSNAAMEMSKNKNSRKR